LSCVIEDLIDGFYFLVGRCVEDNDEGANLYVSYRWSGRLDLEVEGEGTYDTGGTAAYS
jgi:hypothetical protein